VPVNQTQASDLAWLYDAEGRASGRDYFSRVFPRGRKTRKSAALAVQEFRSAASLRFIGSPPTGDPTSRGYIACSAVNLAICGMTPKASVVNMTTFFG
jgi:hypothetical protein